MSSSSSRLTSEVGVGCAELNASRMFPSAFRKSRSRPGVREGPSALSFVGSRRRWSCVSSPWVIKAGAGSERGVLYVRVYPWPEYCKSVSLEDHIGVEVPARSPKNLLYLSFSVRSSRITRSLLPLALRACEKDARHSASSESNIERMLVRGTAR